MRILQCQILQMEEQVVVCVVAGMGAAVGCADGDIQVVSLHGVQLSAVNAVYHHGRSVAAAVMAKHIGAVVQGVAAVAVSIQPFKFKSIRKGSKAADEGLFQFLLRFGGQ